jgi:hypothetical protein
MLLESAKEKRHAYVCFFGKPEGRDDFEDLGIDESTLKCILKHLK